MIKTSSNRSIAGFLRNNPVTAFAGASIIVLLALLLLSLIS